MQLEPKQLWRGRIVFTQIGKLKPHRAEVNSISTCLRPSDLSQSFSSEANWL